MQFNQSQKMDSGFRPLLAAAIQMRHFRTDFPTIVIQAKPESIFNYKRLRRGRWTLAFEPVKELLLALNCDSVFLSSGG